MVASPSPSALPDPQNRDAVEAWLIEQEQNLADLLARRLTKIVREAYNQFIGTLHEDDVITAATGDVFVFESIVPRWKVIVNTDLVPELERIYMSGAISAYTYAPTTDQVPPDEIRGWANVINTQAVEYAATSTNRLVSVGDTVYNMIRDKTSKSIAAGDSVEDLKKGIEQVAGFSEFRADVVARTEVGMAYSQGDYDGMLALGGYGPVEKEWLATGGPRTRKSHREADGQVRPFDQPFDVGSAQLMFTRQPGAPAKEVIQCRCTTLYHFEGDTRRDGSIVTREKPVTTAKPTSVATGRAPFESASQGVAHLRQTHAHVAWEGMDDFDPRSMDMIADWADDMAKSYPEQWARMTYVGSQDADHVLANGKKVEKYAFGRNTYAHAYTSRATSSGQGIIGINPEWGRNYEAWAKSCASGFKDGWSFYETPFDLMTHEFGHIYDGLLTRQVRDVAKTLNPKRPVAALGPGTIDKFGTYTDLRDWLTRLYGKKNMPGWGSRYGAKNEFESFTESFLARHKGLDTPARGIINALDEAARSLVALGDDLVSNATDALTSMENIERILDNNGITARPTGWKTTIKSLKDRIKEAAAP